MFEIGNDVYSEVKIVRGNNENSPFLNNLLKMMENDTDLFRINI